MKEEKFPSTREPSHRQVCGEFWHLRGQLNREGKIKKKKKQKQKNPQNTLLTATPSREVAQMLLSTSSERGLNREVSVLHI